MKLKLCHISHLIGAGFKGDWFTRSETENALLILRHLKGKRVEKEFDKKNIFHARGHLFKSPSLELYANRWKRKNEYGSKFSSV